MVLVAVSAARWAWSALGDDRPGHASADMASPLLEASVEARDEARARAEPLGPGERIDPNRADEIQLDRLPGVGPATARAILAAREGGLVFRKPEDLLEVRGVGPAALSRWDGLLDFDRPPLEPPGLRWRDGGAGPGTLVDVNRATAEDLVALPGVGPALAARIVQERQKRMFTSVDDLTRVPGIGPATVERLRHAARAGPGS